MKKVTRQCLTILAGFVVGVSATAVAINGMFRDKPETVPPIVEDVPDEYMPRSTNPISMETADAEAIGLYAEIEQPEPEIVEIISFDLIALCAYTEAGNQPEEGIRAVVDVIRNRVAHPAFPNTAEAVIMQPKQFAVGKHVVPEEFKQIVFDEWITDTPILSENYVYFDTVPHSYSKNHIQIGAHWFGEI